jgi:hypothetical protein
VLPEGFRREETRSRRVAFRVAFRVASRGFRIGAIDGRSRRASITFSVGTLFINVRRLASFLSRRAPASRQSHLMFL